MGPKLYAGVSNSKASRACADVTAWHRPPPSERKRHAVAFDRCLAASELSLCRLSTDTHPMRSVQLAAVLSRRVWASRPTVLGRTLERSSYALSAPAERADYFVSHAWRDNGGRKVSMLREFLCLQSLFAAHWSCCPSWRSSCSRWALASPRSCQRFRAGCWLLSLLASLCSSGCGSKSRSLASGAHRGG
jgi:hypothetical protein